MFPFVFYLFSAHLMAAFQIFAQRHWKTLIIPPVWITPSLSYVTHILLCKSIELLGFSSSFFHLPLSFCHHLSILSVCPWKHWEAVREVKILKGVEEETDQAKGWILSDHKWMIDLPLILSDSSSSVSFLFSAQYYAFSL